MKGESKSLLRGTSRAGSLEEAIADALGKHVPPHPDALVEFEVVRIGGRQGGIAGLNEVWVELNLGAALEDDGAL